MNGTRVKMDRRRFRDFMQDNMGISSDLLADRVFKLFNTKHDDISLEEWVLGMHVMLRGSRQEQ